MALGGVLRAALRAGDWARAAAQSRRQARALRSFSPEFGTGRGTSAEDFLRSRGVDVEGMLAPGTGNPYMDWVSGPTNYMPDYASSPFGGVVQRGLLGSRSRFGGVGFDYNFPRGIDDVNPYQEFRGPIVAPYEGFRALPGGYNPRMGETMSRPGPWMGRGRGTEWAELPLDGGPPYDSGSYFEQFPGPRAGVFNNPFDNIGPTFPWTAFGEYPYPFPRPGGYV